MRSTTVNTHAADELEPYVSIIHAMWHHVHADLQLGMAASAGHCLGLQAAYFLHTASFARWVAICSGSPDPDIVRERILDLHWPATEPRPPAPKPDETYDRWRRRINSMITMVGGHRRISVD